jgi:putative transposase
MTARVTGAMTAEPRARWIAPLQSVHRIGAMRPAQLRRNGRHSIRLPGHDYRGGGTYFVTICTHEKLCWFGEVLGGRFVATQLGEIVEEVWRSLPERFGQVMLDDYVVMPNHVHGLLVLEPGPSPLGAMVRAFKAASTHLIRASGLEQFGWQRNYHEHMVRNAEALHRIRQYIRNNPRTWETDIFHPLRDVDERLHTEERPHL